MTKFFMGIIAFISYVISGNIFEKGYVIFIIGMLILMIKTLKTFRSQGGKKKLEFILDAQKNGRCVMGKMTCFTKEGTYDKFHYMAEYMYVVNDKNYFVTYYIDPYSGNESNDKEILNGDSLAGSIQKYPMLFYGENNPAQVLCKADAFTSYEAFHQEPTSKSNKYRNVEKEKLIFNVIIWWYHLKYQLLFKCSSLTFIIIKILVGITNFEFFEKYTFYIWSPSLWDYLLAI